jgi:hypothetical protein
MRTRILFSIVLLVASTGALFAQSGRKSTTSSSSTTTPNTPVAAPKTSEKKPAAPKLQLLVGMDRNAVFSNVPFYVYDTVMDTVIRRLGEAEIVLATSGGVMNRADAVRAAKQEKVRWVISLEIRSFYQDSGRQVKNNQDELAVDFTTIEPETGKIKRSGQTRQHIYQNRGGISLPPRNEAGYSEYSIKQAALEAADRILAGFDITVRQRTPF